MDKLNPWQVDYTPRPRGARPSRKKKLIEMALWAIAAFIVVMLLMGCAAEPIAVDPSEASSGWFEVQETPAKIIPAPAPIGR